jgi:hypothetical protein
MDLYAQLRQALLFNELSGNCAAAYRFSDAGGNSGLSFGVTQLDVKNNTDAVRCLQEIGFSAQEIVQLKAKSGDWHALSAKLAGHKATVDKYDMAQIKECLDHVTTVAKARRFSFADDLAIIHAADYNNQFYMSTNGTMAVALLNLNRPVTGKDIYDIKLKMPWGKKDPEDVNRRYNNIQKLFGKPTI